MLLYQSNHIGTSTYFEKEYGTDFSFAPHMHPCFEFITALSGEMTVIVDDSSYRLTSGQGILIFPNQIHSLSSEKCEHMLCIFSPNLVAAFWSKISSKKPLCNLFTVDPYLTERLNGIDDKSKVAAKKGLLYLLCDDFDRTAEYHVSKIDSNDLLQKIFLFLDKNYNGDCSLKSLSKDIGYDYAYLSRYFKKNVGISYNEYLNIYRLNNACYLLENTDDTILHCALESGFTSLRSFNRNFKDRFGVSPSEYIKTSKSK